MMKPSNYPIQSHRRANENLKLVTNLVNSPILTQHSSINELKCFMTHYTEHNSPLIPKKVIFKVKEKLK